MTSEPDILRYLIPVFGERTLDTITRPQMHAFLGAKGQALSSSVVGHLRWHLNAIFKMAQSDGIVERNPAAALFTPAGNPGLEKRVLSKQEIREALGVLDLR